MSALRNWGHWLAEVWRWALREWPLWVLFVVPVLSVALFALLSLRDVSAENWVRYCGLFLEVLGILTVADGLQAKRILFNKPDLAQQVGGAFACFPPLPGKSRTVHISGAGEINTAGTIGVLTGSVAPPPTGATVETRLSLLEGQMSAMQQNHNTLSRQVHQQRDAATAAIDQERNAREKTTGELRSKLEKLGADGLQLEMAGVVWLVLGATLATISGEVVEIIKRLFA
jgi:hypothetical protein